MYTVHVCNMCVLCIIYACQKLCLHFNQCHFTQFYHGNQGNNEGIQYIRIFLT